MSQLRDVRAQTTNQRILCRTRRIAIKSAQVDTHYPKSICCVVWTASIWSRRGYWSKAKTDRKVKKTRYKRVCRDQESSRKRNKSFEWQDFRILERKQNTQRRCQNFETENQQRFRLVTARSEQDHRLNKRNQQKTVLILVRSVS